MLDAECPVRVIEDIHPYASRGGLKLEYALKQFNVSVAEKLAVDIGASSGGFTDCLIQQNVKNLYGSTVLDFGF